ncbi:MAG: hypothetical protein Q8R92_10685 [Deltaproteobacteria bacterium]|nr:hypothetical protein [Deltaproteobacteria bacterium]
MGIHQWHSGKVVLVWVAAVSLLILSFLVGQAVSFRQESLGIAIAFSGLAWPMVAFAISWVWFGGRERK